MYFGFLNLDFGNQIWKFMCRYFAKFSGHFPPKFTFFGLWIFYRIKIGPSPKSLLKNHWSRRTALQLQHKVNIFFLFAWQKNLSDTPNVSNFSKICLRLMCLTDFFLLKIGIVTITEGIKT